MSTKNAVPWTEVFMRLALAMSMPLKGHPDLIAVPAPGAKLTPVAVFFVPGFICDAWCVVERATGCEVAVCSYRTAQELGRAWEFIPE